MEPLQTTHFQGCEWVNLNDEWPRLPDCVKARSEKWRKRLDMLRIPHGLMRLTVIGDITKELEDATKGGRRSAWLPADAWKDHVDAAMDRHIENAQLQQMLIRVSQNEMPDVNDPSPTRTLRLEDVGTLTSVPLDPGERFTYEDVVLPMRLYGTRNPHLIYVNIDDVLEAVGFTLDHVPEFIILNKCTVSTSCVWVVSYEMMIATTCTIAPGSDIAAHLRS